jgi:transcriptional regulator with XRE-family HTH domain
MSLRELSERVDMSHSYISRVAREVGGRTPSVELMRRVAKTLGVPPDYFFEYRLGAVLERLESEPAVIDDLYEAFFPRGARLRRRRT